MNEAIIDNKTGLPVTFCKPHDVVSRAVLEIDLDRVRQDAEIMLYLCRMPVGRYQNGLAVAHSQLTDKDPLRFFVTQDGFIVINPLIVRHTKEGKLHKEGCLSFTTKPETYVKRWYKIEVAFYSLKKDGGLSDVIKATAKGLEAAVFQHEIEHFEGKYIY